MKLNSIALAHWTSYFPRAVYLSYFALFAIASLRAQTRLEPPIDASREQPISLSPFVVETDQDTGYAATNTLAGSRFNTALKDTPSSISVLTSEFLSDIGAFDISDALKYSVNVEYQLDDDRAAVPNGNETVAGYQTYRIRGLKASSAQNYFAWDIPTETAFLERIEESRGPNSVLFGIASAGGLINSNTKQPQVSRAFRKGSFSAGSYDSWRGTMDVNQPVLDGKLAVRFNAVYNKTNTFRHWQHQDQQGAHIGAQYVVNPNTRIRAEFQGGQINSNAPRADNLDNYLLLWHVGGRPTFDTQVTNATYGIARQSTSAGNDRITYISNSNRAIAMRGMMYTNSNGPYGTGVITDSDITGDLTDPSINIGGPAQDRTSRYNAFSTFLERKISRNTFLEVAYNHQGHKFDSFNPQSDTGQRLRGDPNTKLNDGSINPYAGQVYLQAGWQRITKQTLSDTGRIMLSTEMDAKKWGNYRIAALTEYEKGFDGGSSYYEHWYDPATGSLTPINTTPENTQNRAWRISYPIERDWATYYLAGPGLNGGLLSNMYDPVTGRTLSSTWVEASSSTPSEVYSKRKAYLFAAQARYFEGRLIIAAGIRRDNLDRYSQGRMRDPVTKEWIYARNPADADPSAQAISTYNVARNKTLGLVYHVIPRLSVFYNRADNITLPANNTRLPDDGVPGNPIPIAAPRGEGEDMGVALNLLNGKLDVRTTYYTTKGVRQSTTSPSPVKAANDRIMQALYDNRLITQDALSSRENVGGQGLFDHASKGVELQVTANPTRNWRLQASYSYLDAVENNLFLEWRAWHEQNLKFLSQFNLNGVVTSAGRTIPQEIDFYLTTVQGLNEYTRNDGNAKIGSRKHKVTFFSRYDFPFELLKGAYVGGGYTRQSQMYTGLDPDGNFVWAPGFWGADAMAGYTVRGFRKGRLSFQVNIFNLFDDRDPLITRYEWVSGQRLVFRNVPQSPRTWRFTTNFEF